MRLANVSQLDKSDLKGGFTGSQLKRNQIGFDGTFASLEAVLSRIGRAQKESESIELLVVSDSGAGRQDLTLPSEYEATQRALDFAAQLLEFDATFSDQKAYVRLRRQE